MTTKWTTTNAMPGNNGPQDRLGEEFVVLLLHGKNSFGDKIYSYLKITLADLQRLKSAMQSGKGFTASDYGTVIAAGKGEPSPEVRAEVSAMYPIMNDQRASRPPMAPTTQKKAWDEY
jgi:hypothetical protein